MLHSAFVVCFLAVGQAQTLRRKPLSERSLHRESGPDRADVVYEVKLISVSGNYDTTKSEGTSALTRNDYSFDTTYTSKNLNLTSIASTGTWNDSSCGDKKGCLNRGGYKLGEEKRGTTFMYKNATVDTNMTLVGGTYMHYLTIWDNNGWGAEYPVLFRGRSSDGGKMCADVYDFDINSEDEHVYNSCFEVDDVLSAADGMFEDGTPTKKIFAEIQVCPHTVKGSYQFDCGYMELEVTKVEEKKGDLKENASSDQCVLRFSGEVKGFRAATVKYRGKEIAFISQLLPVPTSLALRYPMMHFPEEIKLSNGVDEEFTVADIKNASNTMDYGGITVSLECRTWEDILIGNEDDGAGDDSQASADDIQQCVNKTRVFLDDDQWGQPIESFLHKRRGRKNGKSQSKDINVAFLFPGLNGRPDQHLSTYDNGGVQAHMWYADMCSQLAQMDADFLLVLLPVMYPKDEIFRRLYMTHGMVYVQQYLAQAYVDPILATLSQHDYVPRVHFGGFSMGGILATFNTIHYSMDHSTRLLALPRILDPYVAADGTCAREAFTRAEHLAVEASRKLMESMLWRAHRELYKCINDDLPSAVAKHTYIPHTRIPHESAYSIASLLSLGSPIHGWAMWLPQSIRGDKSWTDGWQHNLSRHAIRLASWVSELGEVGGSGRYHFDGLVFSELGDIKGDSALYYNYITFIGRVLMNDGHIIRARQEQSAHRLPLVFHVNHFNDKTVGFQGKISRGLGELGYMNSGDWGASQKKAPRANDPKVTFTCFFADREAEQVISSSSSFVPDNRNKTAWPRGNLYGSKIDELPYTHKKMMFDADSQALIQLDFGNSGSHNHHSGFVGAKFWTNSTTLGYFHKNARLHLVLQHVVESSFSADPSDICTTSKSKVTVSRLEGSNMENPEYDHVMQFELTSSPTKTDSPDISGLESKITQCNWIGQQKEKPHFKNNVDPQDSENPADEVKACYTGPRKNSCARRDGVSTNGIRMFFDVLDESGTDTCECGVTSMTTCGKEAQGCDTTKLQTPRCIGPCKFYGCANKNFVCSKKIEKCVKNRFASR